jgi:hypothetical protein
VKKIKIFDVVFTNEIEGFEIEAFRGAIAQLVGFEHALFHNHNADNTVSYAYPLVQYKVKGKKASLTFIDQGVDEAKAFFRNKNWEITLSGRTFKLELDTFQLRNAFFSIGTESYEYTVSQWMPLNQDNYKSFKQLKTTDEKVAMLEKILTGNILSLAKSLNWIIETVIKVEILEITDEKLVNFKKNKVATYDFIFKSNVQLPQNIGLGKGVSRGFGVIQTKQKLNPVF